MERFNRIESYLRGEMSEDERRDFENSISKDEKLREEVDLFREIDDAITEQDIAQFRQTVKDMMVSKLEPVPRWVFLGHLFLKLPVAAAILLLIGFSLWKIFMVKSGPDYFNEFYAPYQTDVTTRSINDLGKNKIELSYLLYQEENYEASYDILRNYLVKKPLDYTAQFYLGMDAIELKKYDVAIQSLSKVAQDSLSLYSLHAKWYLALSYLEINNKEKAKEYLQLLSSSENLYSGKSKKLLKKL